MLIPSLSCIKNSYFPRYFYCKCINLCNKYYRYLNRLLIFSAEVWCTSNNVEYFTFQILFSKTSKDLLTFKRFSRKLHNLEDHCSSALNPYPIPFISLTGNSSCGDFPTTNKTDGKLLLKLL